MTERLDTVAPDLVLLIDEASSSSLRRSAADAARQGIIVSRLDGEPVNLALSTLLSGNFGESVERAAIQALIQALDERAWDIQDAIEQSRASESEYAVFFGKARAASALWYALDEDPRRAALEAIYEMYAIHGDIDVVRDLVAPNLVPG